jgi:hypothetical protein
MTEERPAILGSVLSIEILFRGFTVPGTPTKNPNVTATLLECPQILSVGNSQRLNLLRYLQFDDRRIRLNSLRESSIVVFPGRIDFTIESTDFLPDRGALRSFPFFDGIIAGFDKAIYAIPGIIIRALRLVILAASIYSGYIASGQFYYFPVCVLKINFQVRVSILQSFAEILRNVSRGKNRLCVSGE